MSRFTLLLISFILHFSVNAQNETKLSTIALSVVPPTNIDNLSESIMSKLETKVMDIVTENGFSAQGYNQNFVIQSKFEINNVTESAGGMRKIVVANCNFNLVVKQQTTGIIFSTFNKSIQGSEYSKDQAIINALQQINTTEAAVQQFIEKAKSKIVTYYTQNCNNIIQKAETAKGLKKYEYALSILLTIPEEAESCYIEAQKKALATFIEYQKNNCGKLLQQAKAYVAGNDYDNAMRTLSYIDPSLFCAKEATAVLQSFSNKVADDKKKNWEYIFKALDGTITVQKARYQAMSNLTIAWLSSQNQGGKKVVIVN